MPKPKHNTGLILSLPANQDWDRLFTFYQPDATASDDSNNYGVLAATDKVHFEMWPATETGKTPTLSFSDAASSPNSRVVIDTRGTEGVAPAKVTVKVTDTDMNIAVGTYRYHVLHEDVSDDNRLHVVCHGTVEVLPGPI